MEVDTYIGKLEKTKDFDYDLDNKYMFQNAPDRVCLCGFKERRAAGDNSAFCTCGRVRGRTLYWDIVGEVCEKKPNTKQTDWGCFCMKLSKTDLIERLAQDKYKGEVECLLTIAKQLSDTEEYLLVALEIS